MNVYAFDVDDTLEISNGTISLASLMQLRRDGHIVGICGNLNAFCRVEGWQHLVSFTLNFDTYPIFGGPMGSCFSKDVWLRLFRETTFPNADDYVMVGNIIGVTGASDDQGAAQRAGWRFISEQSFANGER